MLLDFDKVFNDVPQTELQIPEALVTYLSKQLPDGLKYALDKNGIHVETKGKEPIRLSGFICEPSDEQRAILGEDYTAQDVMDFSYNAQEPIPLKMKRDGYILLNDQEYPIERLRYNPHNPIKYIEGSAFVYPAPFGEPFELVIGCEEYQRKIRVKRIPHRSVHTLAFETVGESPLFVSYCLNEMEQKMTMSMSIDLSYAPTIRDYVECISIYNAFLEGKGTFVGKPITTKLLTQHIRKFDERSLSFWKKVLEIEGVLDIKFTPPREDIDLDSACSIELLYQNLIHQIPIRDTNKIDTIDGQWNVERKNDIRDSIGQVLYFEFEAAFCISVFGVDLNLPCLLKVFHAKLNDIVDQEDKQVLILKDESIDKPRFTSMLCFKDRESLKEYRDRQHNDVLKLFHDARRAREYLLPNM